MRGVIVGFGSIGKRHAASLQRLDPAIELLVLRRGDAPAEEENAIGAVRIARLQQGIDAKPDFAVIASPPHCHLEALVALLRAGIPCYVEKPVVVRAEEVRALHALLGERDDMPVTLVGCNLRFLPSLHALRAALRAGRIGRPVRASLQVGQWLPDWRPVQDYRAGYGADPAQGGGVIFDLIHELDMARWLFGEFDEVKAIAAKLSTLEIRTEDAACILLRKHGGGPLTAIGLDYVSRQRVRRYEIVGDEGSLQWDLTTRRLELITPGTTEVIDASTSGFDVAGSYVHAMDEFLNALRARRRTENDLADGLRTVALALRARESAGL